MADLRASLQEMMAEKAAQQMPSAPAPQPMAEFGPTEKFQYQKDVAEQYETVVDGLPDNGRVLRNRQTGQEVYVSKGMSTADPAVVERAKIAADQMKLQMDVEQTPRGMMESGIRQEIIQKAGLPGAMGQKVSEGELFTGGTVDERSAALIAQQTGRPYEEVLQQARALSRATQAEYPVASEMAKMTGMAASLSPLALGKKALYKAVPGLADYMGGVQQKIAQQPPLAKQVATVGGGTTAAGLEGFTYGLGEGEDLEGRLAKGVERGGIQMLFTAPISALMTTIGRVREARKVAGDVAQEIATSLGISVESARLIQNAMDDGRTVQETITLLRKAGDEGMIADATESAKSLLDTAANASGPARDLAAQNIEGRIGRQQSQLEQEMVGGLGQPKPPGQTVAETAKQRTAAEAGEAYKGARATPIDYASDAGMAIEDVINRIPTEDVQAAFGLANKLMQSEGKRNMQIMADIAEDGTITFREMPNVMQLDYLKRSLQNMALQNVDAFGKKNEIGMMYDRLAREVRDTTAAAVPEYGRAVSLAREGFMDVEAGKLGEQLLSKKITVDDVIKFAEDASASEREAARLGLRNAIDNIIGDAKKAASRPGDMQNVQVMDLIRNLSSSNNRKKIAQLLGEDVATPMFKRLDEVSQGIQMRSTLGGSQTAGRTAGREGIEEQVAGGFWQSLFTLSPKEFTGAARDFLTGKKQFMGERRDQIAKELVEVLSGRSGKEAELAIKYVKEAIENGKVSQQKAAIIAKELDKAMYQAIPGIQLQRLSTDYGTED